MAQEEHDTPMAPHDTADGGSAMPAAQAVAPVEAADELAAPAPAEEAERAKRPQRGKPRLKLDEVEVGQEFHGKVVGLAKFGAFVDIGAVTDGLVHLTEFANKRVRKPDDALALGQEVDVWVKEVDLASSRISLSMRTKASHPIKQLQPGDVLTGVVTSTADYGVFVDIGSDTEGLVHISEISSGFVQKPADIVKPGDTVEVRVKDVDVARERISLSMVGLANDMGLTAAAAEPAPQQSSELDEEEAAETQERQPTVVELALRRALGEADEPAGAAKAPRKASSRQTDRSLGEVYERMLADYRSSKDQS